MEFIQIGSYVDQFKRSFDLKLIEVFQSAYFL